MTGWTRLQWTLVAAGALLCTFLGGALSVAITADGSPLEIEVPYDQTTTITHTRTIKTRPPTRTTTTPGQTIELAGPGTTRVTTVNGTARTVTGTAPPASTRLETVVDTAATTTTQTVTETIPGPTETVIETVTVDQPPAETSPESEGPGGG